MHDNELGDKIKRPQNNLTHTIIAVRFWSFGSSGIAEYDRGKQPTLEKVKNQSTCETVSSRYIWSESVIKKAKTNMKSLRIHSTEIEMEFAICHLYYLLFYITDYIIKDGLRENRAFEINYRKIGTNIIK